MAAGDNSSVKNPSNRDDLLLTSANSYPMVVQQKLGDCMLRCHWRLPPKVAIWKVDKQNMRHSRHAMFRSLVQVCAEQQAVAYSSTLAGSMVEIVVPGALHTAVSHPTGMANRQSKNLIV